MKKLTKDIFNFSHIHITEFPIIEAIRRGLVFTIPILIIGSFALLFQTLPIDIYQQFIRNLYNGIFYGIVSLIHFASFGLVSIYVVLTISSEYARISGMNKEICYGAVITSLISFGILSGAFVSTMGKGIDIRALGFQGMFAAIITACVSTYAYMILAPKMQNKIQILTDGADLYFNIALRVLPPAAIIISVAATIEYFIISSTSAAGIHDFFAMILISLFINIGSSFESGLLFVMISSIMRFLGLHGNNIMEVLVNKLFTPGSAGAAKFLSSSFPPYILTKPFFDVFVLMGGSGTLISLLIASFLFSKRTGTKHLAKLAAFPMIFNVNELMAFGFPIIMNPLMLTPVIITPAVCYTISYLAITLKLVPMPTEIVSWTTPVIMSGCIATGSLRGAILQIVNICIGVMIYRPFVVISDKNKTEHLNKLMQKVNDILHNAHKKQVPIQLTNISGEIGSLCRELAEDLRHAINAETLDIYYQPQFNNNNECNGAEALLRWEHPLVGTVSPEIIMQLAEEKGILQILERSIVRRVISNIADVRMAVGCNIPISVNVSVQSIESNDFEEFLAGMIDKGVVSPNDLHIEMTEQMTLSMTEDVFNRLDRIRDMGFPMEIDDFTMGHTSLMYLQGEQFGTVKLDGAIVKNMLVNPRSLDIISSIIELSHKLHFKIIAEYVDTKEIRDKLEELGCYNYQGWLFTPALSLKDLSTRFETRKLTKKNRKSVR